RKLCHGAAGRDRRRKGERAAGASGSIERAGRHRLDPPRGRRRYGRARGSGRHQSDRQERALQIRLRRAGPHRISGEAGAGGDWTDAAAGHAAVGAGTSGGAGDDSSAVARHLWTAVGRTHRRDRAHRGARPAHTVSHRAAPPCDRGIESARRRARHARRRGPRHRCAGGGATCCRRYRGPWTAAGRLHVSRGRALKLRRGLVHVSRPGADPDQDAGVRSRRQRHARIAVRAHVARPRHGIRYCRHRQSRSEEPDRRVAARRAARRRRQRGATDVTGAAAAPAIVDGLPPLREVVRRHGLAPKKSLGQNFLFDLNLAARIARAAGPLDGMTVFEVGPGPGGLTRALLALGAARVVAVERDDRAIAALHEIAARYPGRLDIVAADALSYDPRPALHGPVRIAANLPYNIATALLVSWLSAEPWPPWYDAALLMFQREVAERIVAAPHSKSYGRLSVLAQWRCEAKILFDVNASAFVPPPNVKSSIVHLLPRR